MNKLPKLVLGRSAILELWERYERELKSRGKQFAGSYRTRGADVDSHDAYCFPSENIYWKSGDSRGQTRYWNSFGEGEPSELRDAFQVSIPKDGFDRRIRGGFLTRGKEVFLLHRGSLGGGRKDGSHNLKDMVPEFVDAFEDDDRESDGVLFPFLDAKARFHKDFLPKVAKAVKIVAKRLDRR
jgi:hypothetical protein